VSVDQGSGSSDPGSSSTQRQQVREYLRGQLEPLTDWDIRDALGIPESSVRTRLIELYDLEGSVEPLKAASKADRQHWQWVPPDRRVEVKQEAIWRHKSRLLRSIQREPLGTQAWLVERLMDPSTDWEEEQRLLEEPCPGLKDLPDCNCTSVNLMVTRHRIRNQRRAQRSRASQAAAELRRIRRDHRLAMEAERKEDSPSIQYLTYKQYVREAIVYLSHMAGFVIDEIEFKKENGYSELSDQKWLDIRDMVTGEEGAQISVDELRTALDRLIGDDVIDVEEVFEYNYDDMEIEDAEVLELEPGD
jgi:hypothetical protein